MDMKRHITILIFLILNITSSLINAQNFKSGELIIKSQKAAIQFKVQSNTYSAKDSSLDKYKIKSVRKVNTTRSSQANQLSMQSRIFDEGGVFYVELEDKSLDMELVAREFQQSQDIVWAQPNYIYKIQSTPNDTFYSDKQWNMPMIQFNEVWSYINGNSNVVISVIDTGVDLTHPDLKESVWVNLNEIPNNNQDDDSNGYVDDVSGWNFVANTNDPSDDNLHGTHVSGIAAAQTNNQEGIAGVGSSCSIMALKAGDKFGSFTSLSISEAITYAINNGSNILNLSFGAKKSKVPQEQLLKDSIDTALANNCLVVCAAGNISLDINDNEYIPAFYDGVITVSAVRETGLFADGYSNFGNRVDISAPGGALIAGEPEKDIYSTVPQGAFFTPYFNNAGTSMAAPHISGTIGLLMSIYPSLTPDQIKEALFNSAEDIGDTGKDTLYGYGLLRMKDTLTYFDSDSPTGSHKPVQAASIAQDILVTANFTDDFSSSSLPLVTIYYLYLTETTPIGTWQIATMNKSGNEYSYTIPNSNMDITDIHYYFKAKDLKPNETTLPSTAPGQPYSIVVQDITGPSIQFPTVDKDYISLGRPLIIPIIDNVAVSTSSIQVQIKYSDQTLNFTTDSSEISFNDNQLIIDIPSLDLPTDQTIAFKVSATDTNNNLSETEQSLNHAISLKVFGPDGEHTSILNGPNPFNPHRESTYIQYQLSKDAEVQLYIYSISGEKLWRTQFSSGDSQGGSPGFHSVEWSGRNDFGETVANGPYIVYLIAKSGSETKVAKTKILVLK